MIRTIQWTDAGVEMIDQRLLPTEVVYRTYQTVDEVAEAIKTMVVRGAPALGIAAAMGVALGVRNLKSSDDLDAQFKKMCQTIAATRPTARNLFWGIERMGEVFKQYRNAPLAELQRAMKEEAIKVYHEDLETNRRMGMVGQEFLRDKTTVLTHCNAGALCAAGDWGTALGVIRAAISQGKQIHVFADETRPFLQGARLTAWELTEDGIPCTLITDNMAGFFMKAGRIQAVVVGADRIAKNGDTANKVGTYSVAVLAKEHGIPFYVAAPLSTIDLSIRDGGRDPDRAALARRGQHHRRSPDGTHVSRNRKPRVRRDASSPDYGDLYRRRGRPAALRLDYSGAVREERTAGPGSDTKGTNKNEQALEKVL